MLLPLQCIDNIELYRLTGYTNGYCYAISACVVINQNATVDTPFDQVDIAFRQIRKTEDHVIMKTSREF